MELQIIQQRIHEIRRQKVMLDFDLAELYEVETRVLNQAVKRNLTRFPADFMFQLSDLEWRDLRSKSQASSQNLSQFVIGSQKHREFKKTPLAFAEQGVAMLTNVLRSEKAIQMNIAIMRAFVFIRHYALPYKELAQQIAKLEGKYDLKFADVYQALDLLKTAQKKRGDWEKRVRIGFKK